MTCLMIAGILFIQTPDKLITVDDIIDVYENSERSRIELSLGQDGGWVQIEGQTIGSLVACLKVGAAQ